MKTIKIKLLLILVFVAILSLSTGYYILLRNNEINSILLNTPEKATNSIQQASDLNDLAGTIQYLDEVLTQSARNYALTSNVIWKNRYNDNAPILEAAIKSSTIIGDQNDIKLFSDISAANLILTEMEAQSITLVDNGNIIDAQTILDSTAYSNQKAIYSSGLDTFHRDKGAGANNALATSIEDLKNINNQVTDINITNGFLISGLIIVFVIIAIIIYMSAYLLILKPISIIRKATTEIAKGHLDHLVRVGSKNEIGDLARSFNVMASILKESVQNIENKIASRTEELQRLNHFMTGRELKMIELKQQLKDLGPKNEIKR